MGVVGSTTDDPSTWSRSSADGVSCTPSSDRSIPFTPSSGPSSGGIMPCTPSPGMIWSAKSECISG